MLFGALVHSGQAGRSIAPVLWTDTAPSSPPCHCSCLPWPPPVPPPLVVAARHHLSPVAATSLPPPKRCCWSSSPLPALKPCRATSLHCTELATATTRSRRPSSPPSSSPFLAPTSHPPSSLSPTVNLPDVTSLIFRHARRPCHHHHPHRRSNHLPPPPPEICHPCQPWMPSNPPSPLPDPPLTLPPSSPQPLPISQATIHRRPSSTISSMIQATEPMPTSILLPLFTTTSPSSPISLFLASDATGDAATPLHLLEHHAASCCPPMPPPPSGNHHGHLLTAPKLPPPPLLPIVKPPNVIFYDPIRHDPEPPALQQSLTTASQAPVPVLLTPWQQATHSHLPASSSTTDSPSLPWPETHPTTKRSPHGRRSPRSLRKPRVQEVSALTKIHGIHIPAIQSN